MTQQSPRINQMINQNNVLTFNIVAHDLSPWIISVLIFRTLSYCNLLMLWTLMNNFPVTMGCLCHFWILILPWNVSWSVIVLTCHGLLLELGKQRGNIDNWSEDGAERGPRMIADCLLLSLGWSRIWSILLRRSTSFLLLMIIINNNI